MFRKNKWISAARLVAAICFYLVLLALFSFVTYHFKIDLWGFHFRFASYTIAWYFAGTIIAFTVLRFVRPGLLAELVLMPVFFAIVLVASLPVSDHLMNFLPARSESRYLLTAALLAVVNAGVALTAALPGLIRMLRLR